MYVSFEEIADQARVWIYQSDRKFTNSETNALEEGAKTFAEQWAAHGTGLTASAKVLHNQFLVLAVDESAHNASGCSIDSSVSFVKSAEKEFGINFFDRTRVAFLLNDDIYLESIQNLKEKIENEIISKDSLTFNNLVGTIGEMKANWLLPAKETWLERYF